MSVAIYDTRCPNCDAVIWYSNGDESDVTGLDTTHLVCHACNHTFLLDAFADFFPDPDGEGLYTTRMVGLSYPDAASATIGARFA